MTKKILTSLHFYPVKGCKGLAPASFSVGQKGPNFDRRWMIIDENGRFLSQRQIPKMALIETAIDKEFLRINIPNEQEICLPVTEEGQSTMVTVWKDTCPALDQGDKAAEALSRYLEIKCRLVFMPESTIRQVNLKYASVGETVGFADAYPFLLISEASLEDLNSRLEKPILMNRFRPNLVVSGCKPHEEDTWKWIRIGEIRFKVAKPCSRCTVTTIDQLTLEQGREPLQTLAEYRKMEGGIMFGANLIHTTKGSLQVGDVLEVIE
jgi:uncharacterized protein YcbX